MLISFHEEAVISNMHQRQLLSRRRTLELIGCGALGWMRLDRRAAAEGNGLAGDDSAGLRVKQGAYWLGGRPVRAFGVNYFDCFMRTLAKDRAESEAAFDRCEAGFRELSGLGIPFVRFNAGGFYPKDWRLYEREPEVYLARMARLVRMAESHGLGLVPSLFWMFFTQPGRAGEPLAAWGDTNSRTHAMMRRYVDEVVGRFHRSSAVWAWEFGNEYNLETDLPNQQELLQKWYRPSLGMPAEPGPRDLLRSRDVVVATQAFAAAVRATDPERAIFTGNACPRASAWHLDHERSWTADSCDQWREALEKQNPRDFAGLSLHLYPFHEENETGLADAPGEATLQAAAAVAERTGQPLWIGEFGPAPTADPATRLTQFQTILGWLELQNVALAAAWVYDYPAQPENNLSAVDNRPLLEALGDANGRG